MSVIFFRGIFICSIVRTVYENHSNGYTCMAVAVEMCLQHMQQNEATALIWAAVKGHAECVRMLMEAGADKDAAGIVRSCFLEFLLFLSFICFQDIPPRVPYIYEIDLFGIERSCYASLLPTSG